MTGRLAWLPIFVLLVVLASSPLRAEVTKYSVFLTDGTELKCSIVSNDPEGRRLQIQESGKPDMEWISYHKIKAIIEEDTQLDVTGKFVTSLPLSVVPQTTHSEPASEPTTVKSGMGSGTVIALSILGTIALLVLIGALAS